MQKNILKIQGVILVILILLLSLSILISITDMNKLLYLPLIICYTTGVSIYFFTSKKNNASLVINLILMTYGIRMVIYPLMVIIPEYKFPILLSMSIENNVPLAILMQCYEFIIVLFTLILSNKSYKQDYNFDGHNLTIDSYSTIKIRRVIIFLSAISLFFIALYPQILTIFEPVYIFSEELRRKIVISANIAANNTPTVLYYLSTWLLRILRILLVYWIVITIKKRLPETKKNGLKLALSIFTTSTLMLVTTNDRAAGIYAGIAMLFMLMKLYPEQRKMITKLLVGTLTVGGSLLLIIFPMVSGQTASMYNSTNFFHFLAQKLNAYFSGTVNIAASLEMPRDTWLDYLIGDLLRTIPMIKGFFTEYDLSNMLFNEVLGYDSVYYSQIIPNIGQGYYYLGFLLAPIFSIVLIRIAIKSERKAKRVNDSLGYYVYTYCSIYFAVSPILYYFQLTLNLVLFNIVPIIILYELFRVRMNRATDIDKY